MKKLLTSKEAIEKPNVKTRQAIFRVDNTVYYTLKDILKALDLDNYLEIELDFNTATIRSIEEA